jgi:hypothetical protein
MASIICDSQSLNQFGGDAANNGIRLDILGHNGSRTYNGVFTNCHAR